MVSEIYFLINMLMIDEIRNEVNIEYIIDFEMYEKEKRKKNSSKINFPRTGFKIIILIEIWSIEIERNDTVQMYLVCTSFSSFLY